MLLYRGDLACFNELSPSSARTPPDPHSLTPPLVTWVVGSVPDGVAEAPSPEWDRRLELPFTVEVAAA